MTAVKPTSPKSVHSIVRLLICILPPVIRMLQPDFAEAPVIMFLLPAGLAAAPAAPFPSESKTMHE